MDQKAIPTTTNSNWCKAPTNTIRVVEKKAIQDQSALSTMQTIESPGSSNTIPILN
jgi:hypothetical protein